MGKLEILTKLKSKFNSTPKSEEDVVYVLSRVRKVLEINNFPQEYSTLNFYCNLALHYKITRPPAVVVDKLKEVADGTSYSRSIIGFSDFHEQLRAFLEDNNLPNFYKTSTPDDRKIFNESILDVWSDTPIKIEYNGKDYTVVLKKTSVGTSEISFEPVKKS